MQLSNKICNAALCLIPLLLSACGGGGGGGGGTTAGTTTVRSVYVANYGTSDISQYTIDATTGALTHKTPALVTATALNAPTSVIVDAAEKHVYVANSLGSDISQFSIGQGGVLVAMTPSQSVQSGTVAGAGPISIAISGGYAYAANNSSINAGGVGDITQFSIDPTTGALTNRATFLAGTSPVFVATTNTTGSNYAYVLNAGFPCPTPALGCTVIAPTISEYSINSTTGALTSIGTVTLGVDTAPASITVDSAGKFAYLANSGTPCTTTPGCAVPSSITQFSISLGVLTAGPSLGPLAAATSIVIDPAGTHAYVANGFGVYQYAIDSVTGAMTLFAPTIYAGGTTQKSITINEGKFVYMANQGSDDISQFSIGPGGALSIIGPNLAGAFNSQPYSIATAVTTQ